MPISIATDPAGFSAAVAARRQYVADTAPCRECGTAFRACQNDAVRTHPKHPDWPEARCCTLHCNHVQDTRALGALIDEIAAGKVRTLTEAYLPPVLGPNLPSWTWRLDQDIWWYPYRRPAVLIASMDKPWRWNAARSLERLAPKLEGADRWRSIWADAPDDVIADLETRIPQEFLDETPLYRALTRGLPDPRGARGRRLAERAVHWNTCPMRLAHPGALDRCVCVRTGDRVTGATNDPGTVAG